MHLIPCSMFTKLTLRLSMIEKVELRGNAFLKLAFSGS